MKREEMGVGFSSRVQKQKKKEGYIRAVRKKREAKDKRKKGFLVFFLSFFFVWLLLVVVYVRLSLT